MRDTLDRLYLYAGYAAGLLLIAIFALLMIMSTGRQIGLNVPAGDDIVSWCMAAMAFLALAHTFKRGELIRMGLVIDKVHGRARIVFEFLALTLGTIISGYFAYHATVMTYQSWLFNDVANGVLPIPLWIPQLSYCGGLIVLTIAFVDELLLLLLGRFPSYAKKPPRTAQEVLEHVQSGGH